MAEEYAPVRLRVARPGDPQFDEMFGFAEMVRATLAPHCGQDAEKMVSAMTACVMVAGSMFGMMIVGGFFKDQDRRRATESMATNFRQGIDVGKQHAFRAFAGAQGEGHA